MILELSQFGTQGLLAASASVASHTIKLSELYCALYL